MRVYEIKVEVATLVPINRNKARISIANLIDMAFVKEVNLEQFHHKNEPKGYSFGLLYPLPKGRDAMYDAKKIYTFRIRCVDERMAEYLKNTLFTHGNSELKVITTHVRVIKNPMIESLTTTSPMITLNNNYWRTKMSLSKMTKNLNEKLIRKYNALYYKDLPLNTKVIKSVEVLNNKPIVVNSYNKSFHVCDIVRIIPETTEIAREIITMALATGIGTKTSRGFGFVKYNVIREEVSRAC